MLVFRGFRVVTAVKHPIFAFRRARFKSQRRTGFPNRIVIISVTSSTKIPLFLSESSLLIFYGIAQC